MDILKNISIVFLSIFYESLPFLLLGSLLSSIIEELVSEETIAKLIPKNKVFGSLVGVCLGFFIPACDCAVIPVAKRLIKKKVPINVAISFMLASPIINPVVLLSTYSAFYKTTPSIFWGRLFLGMGISLVVGIIMGILFSNQEVIRNRLLEEEECIECHHHEEHQEGIKNRVKSILEHTGLDFLSIMKYLVIGALIASMVQILLPRSILKIFTGSKILSILILMIFAYLISLCSTSDSFVGKSFLTTFGSSSVLAYLLLGPMIDIKNTIVLLGNYKKKFVFTLIFLIFITIWIASILVVNIS